MSRTRWVLLLVLLSTLIAAWFAPPLEDQASEVSSSRPPSQGAQSADLLGDTFASSTWREGKDSGSRGLGREAIEVLEIRSRVEEEEEEADPLSDLFSSPDWTRPALITATQPPQMPQVKTEPATPTAPPLPFTLIGSINEGGIQKYFLRSTDENFVVQVGDVLTDQYRIEGIEGNQLQLRHLPTNQLQSLGLGNSL